MQLPMIAALLLAPPAAETNLCHSLKAGIDRAPYGFTELPEDFFAEPYAGDLFRCVVKSSAEYDVLAPRHTDLVCETPMREVRRPLDPKDDAQVALRGLVAECLGVRDDPKQYIFDTPDAWVEVSGSFVLRTSRVPPTPPTTASTVLVIHAKP